jgi:hypothetical protein
MIRIKLLVTLTLREWKGNKTRAEVRVELAAAQRAGQIPHGHAATVAALFDDFNNRKTRAQLFAEMLGRLGLIPQSGEAAESKLISPEQAQRICQAGLRAARSQERALPSPGDSLWRIPGERRRRRWPVARSIRSGR